MSKLCRNCGAVMDDASKFCDTCGQKADAGQPTQNNQNNQYDPYGQQGQGFQNYQNNQNYQNYQNPYQQNPYGSMYNSQPMYQSGEQPESLGRCLGTLLIMCIPIVGLVYMILIVCNATKHNKTIVNFYRASLIIAAILLVIYIIIALAVGANMYNSVFRSSGSYYV